MIRSLLYRSSNSWFKVQSLSSKQYSIKNGSTPNWLRAVLKIKKFADKASEENVTNWKTTMINLENIGCHSYQVLEAPAILNLAEEELLKRMDLMQNLSIDDISMPLIGFVNVNRTGEIKTRYRTYIERTKGFVSVADFWKHVLECSEEDMDNLLLSNPRLLKGERTIDERLRKAQFLFERGIKKTDLMRSSHLLLNHTYDTIVERVEELRANDILPLSVPLIAQAEKQYRNSLSKKLHPNLSGNLKFLVLKDLLGADQEVLKHPVYKNTSLDSLRERIDYLLNVRGYDPEDIINCPTILQRIKVERLEKAFHELEEAGLDDIQLATVVTYINHRRLPAYRKGSQMSVAKNLGFDTHNMADVSHSDFAGLFQQKSSVMQRNFRYLNEVCGFPSAVILDVPIILGHSHELLVEHWESLPAKHEALMKKWGNNHRKLLNLLQYDIEKSVNFKHSVLTSNTTE